jgi:hypothetical protein
VGQLVDLHARVQDLLAEVKTAAGGQLRVYPDPPVQLPEMPCVFALTPDEDFQRLDTMTGERSVTVVVRLCVEASRPQTALLELADTIIQTADVWLWNDPPAPLDRARRMGMRGVTPVFGEIPVRGADFPISVQMVAALNPAP